MGELEYSLSLYPPYHQPSARAVSLRASRTPHSGRTLFNELVNFAPRAKSARPLKLQRISRAEFARDNAPRGRLFSVKPAESDTTRPRERRRTRGGTWPLWRNVHRAPLFVGRCLARRWATRIKTESRRHVSRQLIKFSDTPPHL